jgi:transglutaminase-like putative cysteine protease
MTMNAQALQLAGDELARAAESAGCRVLARGVHNDGASSWPVLELECDDNAHAIDFLNRAASLDAGHPDLRALALWIRRAHGEPLAYAQAVQAFVKALVRFVREVRETFQHALYTLQHHAGDCDDHARAVVALARAGGLRATVRGVVNARGAVSHVAPLISDGRAWHWAETTVDARFGEHPRTAAHRLGLERPDIWAARRNVRGTSAP